MTALVQIIAFTVFAAKRLLTYLHIYQQEEYDSRRFLAWIAGRKAIDKRLSLAVVVALVLNRVIPSADPYVAYLPGALFLISAWIEADPRKQAKKKLVLTTRARRIYVLALVLGALAGMLAALWSVDWLWILAIQAVPLLLVTANLLLWPFENRVQQKFWNEARDKIEALSPLIVGITGSFGKTSVKHILGHVLQATGQALMTPGSVNTPMGITRIIRERLTAQHKYFVVEMGAYGPGSIARLCKLTPPDIALITAIGPAHYERFKSLDTVARTKFELAEAVIRKNGHVITHQELLAYSNVRSMVETAPDQFIICRDDDTAFGLKEIRQHKRGLSVDILWQGEAYTLEAPLFGKHHGRNMALAFAAACHLGIPPQTVVTALKSTPQIAHRLEVKPQPPGMLLIDDAYNSNPKGFEAAIDLVRVLKDPEGRGILITPGMVELGRVHDSEHAKLGARAAESIDILLAVAPERITAFTSAFENGAPSGREWIPCRNFEEAQTWLSENARPGDVVLMENDLPDLYETRLKI